jgi:aerobic carbon-monoxide dehydrogenase large subunit
MSILGNRVLRREDPALLVGGGAFVDNVDLPGAAHVTFVRSPFAHARITGIDTSAAAAMPGVLAIVTAADLEGALTVTTQAPPSPLLNQEMLRPLLATDTVRFVGEPVVAVVTEQPYQGTDAAEAVVVDYDDLTPVIDPAAAATDAVLVHPDVGGNTVMQRATRSEADFSGCDVVVTQSMTNQRLAPCPIEPRVAAAEWVDGRLVQYASSQGVHPVRDGLASLYGLERDQVRVIGRDVGGSFGSKTALAPEEVLLGHLARLAGRPVRWLEARSVDMVNLGHGRGQRQKVTIGGGRDGRITAYRLEILQDAGAYPGLGALLPVMTQMMLTGVYDIDNVECRSHAVATTTTPLTAYRGAGRPEAAAAIERAVDVFSAEIGMDPAEVRRRNVLPPFSEAHTTATRATYDCGNYGAALELALDSAGYDQLRREQSERRARGDRRQLGIGLSVYVEITAFGGGGEFASVELRPEGTFLARTGSSPYGQGHYTSWAMIVADRLGVPMDSVEVVHGDTDEIPAGGITGGSRSAQIAGSAMLDASGRVDEQARQVAAELLEAAAGDVVLDRVEGAFHVAGTPAVSVSWNDVAQRVATSETDPLVGVSEFAAEGSTFPFGAHVALVEVDTETGKVELLRLVAVDDAGTILNPMLVEGQVHGGLAQGAAQALLEEFRYDDEGNPLTANFGDYAVISAAELPSFERIPMETPTYMNPLGAKGIGESGTIGSTPAVHNAVVDALSYLGVRHVDMPCTPEKVWRAMAEAAEA